MRQDKNGKMTCPKCGTRLMIYQVKSHKDHCPGGARKQREIRETQALLAVEEVIKSEQWRQYDITSDGPPYHYGHYIHIIETISAPTIPLMSISVTIVRHSIPIMSIIQHIPKIPYILGDNYIFIPSWIESALIQFYEITNSQCRDEQVRRWGGLDIWEYLSKIA